MHFKHEMIGKHFTETSNKVELRINRVRISYARPVKPSAGWVAAAYIIYGLQQSQSHSSRAIGLSLSILIYGRDISLEASFPIHVLV